MTVEAMELPASQVAPGEADLVYDVGLHLGEDTAYYLALGHRVIAFEANPDLVARCERRFASEIAEGTLVIVAGAIAPTGSPPTVTFYRNVKSVWGTISVDWAERNAKLFRGSTAITVPTVDFQDCLARYGVPQFLKVDVEGVDGLVVETACALENPPAYLSMESEKVDFDRLVSDVDRLCEAGYSGFKIVQQASIPGSVVDARKLNGERLRYRFEKHSSGPFGEQLPGPWLGRDQAIERYRRIFMRYRLIGDRSVLGRYARVITKPVEKMFRIGIPGWHDLHARRG
jgi:FkbM family methyltransferase